MQAVHSSLHGEAAVEVRVCTADGTTRGIHFGPVMHVPHTSLYANVVYKTCTYTCSVLRCHAHIHELLKTSAIVCGLTVVYVYVQWIYMYVLEQLTINICTSVGTGEAAGSL